jgi:hypothetical protein
MSRTRCGQERVAARSGANGNRTFSRRETANTSERRAQAARSPRQHRQVELTWALGARFAFELIDEIDRNDLDGLDRAVRRVDRKVLRMPARLSAGELRSREGVCWGLRPDGASAPKRPKMQFVSWRQRAKGSLRGSAIVALPIGVKINDVPALVSHGKARAALPSRSQLEKESGQKPDANGRPTNMLVVEWPARSLADRFSATVVELIRRELPEAVDGGST